MKRVVAWGCGTLLALLFLLLLVAGTPLGTALWHLLFGWVSFLLRNVPQIAGNWNVLGMAVVCSLVALLVGNWLLSALFGEVQQLRRPDQPARPWRWRWTFGLFAAMGLLFIIVFGVVGVYRHTTWLMNGPTPWNRPRQRVNAYVELRTASIEVEMLAEDNDRDLAKTRAAFLAEKSRRREQGLLCEEFDVIFYADANDKVAAYVIVPRHSPLLDKGQFAVSPMESEDSVKPISDLPATIARLDATYGKKLP